MLQESTYRYLTSWRAMALYQIYILLDKAYNRVIKRYGIKGHINHPFHFTFLPFIKLVLGKVYANIAV